MDTPTWTPPPPHQLALPGEIRTKGVPFNQQAEEAILGSLLIDRDAVFKIRPYLAPGDFYFADTLGAVYGTICALADRRVPADLVTLADALARAGLLERIGGPGTLAHWLWCTPTCVHVEYYAHLVAEYAAVRRLISEGGAVAGLGYTLDRPADAVLAEARQRILDATAPRDTAGLRPVAALADELAGAIFAPEAQPGQVRGVPSGLAWLDALTSGFLRQNVYVLAARPAMGKTSLMVQIAAFNASLGVNVGVFSLEMSAEQIMQRFLAHSTPCDLQALQSGYRMDKTTWARVHTRYQEIREQWTLFLDPSPASDVQVACARARQRALTDGLDLICFDYLQLFQTKRRAGENREQEVAAVSRALKDLARELDVPVLALGQLSRNAENRPGPPRLSDLRESGAVEQDAYLVAFLHHEYGATDGVTDLIVEKHRNGPTGATRLRFDGATTTFHDDLTRREVGR